MSQETSNRDLLDRWSDGDERAAAILVDRYMVRLTALARARLSRKLAQRLDPEDIVLSAWRSFFMSTQGGRIAVPDNDDLWPLLLTITLRKLRRQAARHRAEKRSFRVEQSLDALSDWKHIVSRDPAPEAAAIVADEVEQLLQELTEVDGEILVSHLQGLDKTTIAEQRGCSERTVRRVLSRLRDIIERRRVEQRATEQSPTVRGPAVEDDLVPIESSASPTEPSVPRATVSEGDFLLQEFIGQGGFGRVYRAVDRRTNETVAVKYLKKRFWEDRRAVDGLIRENAALQQLTHPGIMRSLGWGRSAGGAVFVVMELVDGFDFATWAETGGRTVAELCGIVADVADAVAAAHQAKIIHADLTPRNVLIDEEITRPILTDFGFSTVIGNASHRNAGGTAGFMAPEQVSDAFGPLTEQTDVYGLGGMLYGVLTGRPPFVGNTIADVLAGVLSAKAPVAPSCFNSAICPTLDRLILQCLSKDSTARPADAAEISVGLRSLINNRNESAES